MTSYYDFYTYAYLRKTDLTPYYIGKGRKGRAWSKNRGKIAVPKDKSRILILKSNLSEEDAWRHEIYMIAVFGRKDLGTGILHNRTDGGDGKSGAIISIETRKKISFTSLNRPEEEKIAISRKLSEIILNRPEEEKIAIAQKKAESMATVFQNRTKEEWQVISSNIAQSYLTRPIENEKARRSGISQNMMGVHKGKIWFVHESGETAFRFESPGAEWQQGRKWKPN